MLRAFLLLAALLPPGMVQGEDAATLRERYEVLREELAKSPFGRPMHVRSASDSGSYQGEVYAVIEQSFGVVAPALARPANWCDVLMLQVNVKRCAAPGSGAGPTVSAFITRKPREALESAYRIEFRYRLPSAGADYLRVALSAPSGPMGTRDYAIRVEAIPLEGRRTFLHTSYAYSLGLMARVAMDAYLATSGRDKMGFSVVDRSAGGEPVYVDGVRGVIERSAMRHYLAIEAYLYSLGAPEGERLQARLEKWYAGIERYPQLREEVGREEYVQMKRREAQAG
jgi:hypothetical protein